MIVQKPRTVEILSSDYLFLTFIGDKLSPKKSEIIFLQQWRISVFITFRESLTENSKYENAKFLAFNWSTTPEKCITIVCSM
jgi:hypothetical protein